MAKAKYIAAFLAAGLMASSAFAAQKWIQIRNKAASEITLYSGDQNMLQMGGPGTFTVDQDITGYSTTLIFGSGSTNVSPSYIQIDEGKTFEVNALGANNSRPTSSITFQGGGTLVLTGTDLNFVESGPNISTTGGDEQHYYFKQSGQFNLANKQITVRNNNFVEMDNVNINATKLTMTGTSSIKMIVSSNSSFKGISMSGSSSLILQSSASSVHLNTTTSFGDGTEFHFLNAAGTSLATGISLFSTVNIGAVNASELGTTVYIEDNNTTTVSAGEHTIKVGSLIMKTAGTLNLNSSNAFYTSSGDQSTLRISVVRANAKLNLGADNAIGELSIKQSGTNPAGTLFVSLGGNALNLGTVTISSDESMLYFTDFAEDLVYVDSALETLEDGSLKNIFSVEVNGNDILSYTKLYQNGAGFLTAVVPEPAAAAFIFGALALGFVAYRRRR